MPRNTPREARPALIRHAKTFAEGLMARKAIDRSHALEWTSRELGFPDWNRFTAYARNHPHPAISGTSGPDLLGGMGVGSASPKRGGHLFVFLRYPDHLAGRIAARLLIGPEKGVMVLPELSEANAESHRYRLREGRKYDLRFVCPVFLPPVRGWGDAFGHVQWCWESCPNIFTFYGGVMSPVSEPEIKHTFIISSFPGKSEPMFEEKQGPVGPQVSTFP